MTHLPELWSCLQKQLPKGEWTSLSDIYRIIEDKLSLDKEDYQWQSPTSDTPKWKRNVRNVLQYRKRTREIEWDGDAMYRM